MELTLGGNGLVVFVEKTNPQLTGVVMGKFFFIILSSLPFLACSKASAKPSGSRSFRLMYLPSLIRRTKLVGIGGSPPARENES